MALLIYKQWHRPPNKKYTPYSNRKHVEYIGSRVGVLKDNEAENGLFGKINGQFQGNLDMANTLKHVHNVSKKAFTMYRSVISVRFDERLGMGFELHEREQWEKFAQYHANTIAEKNGIKLENFEYVAAAHEKDGNTHLHFVFWDKNQSVAVNVVNPNIPDEIRKEIEDIVADDVLLENGFKLNSKEGNAVRTALIKGVYKEELGVIYAEKDDAGKSITSRAESSLVDIRGSVNFDMLFDKLVELNNERPRSRSNKYKYMSADFKMKLDAFADMLMVCSPDLKREVERFIDIIEMRSDIFNSSESNYGKYISAKNRGKARDEVYNRIGNKVLQSLKANNRVLSGLPENNRRASFSQQDKSSLVENLAYNISFLLRMVNMNNSAGADSQDGDAHRRGDMSKAAVKDMVYKNQDKGEGIDL
jgi:hypothetical protein